MKFKLIAMAAVLATSASSSFAAIDGATSGNGSLLLNFISQGGTSATSGGDDMSALFDLGVSMNEVIGWNGLAGFSKTWSLNSANFGGAWNSLLNFSTNDAAIEFNVIALDNTDKTTLAGGSRYLTTYNANTFVSLTNSNLNGFDGMDKYVIANNPRGTHATEADGASVATPTDPTDSYFRAINGFGMGDTWLQKTTADTTKTLSTAQNFWYLETTAAGGTTQAKKTAFGVDLDRNGTIGAGEFAKWSVDMNAGTVTYAAPVPEPETFAMLLAGLGLMGSIVRRRRKSV